MSAPVRVGLVGGTSVEAEGLPLILPRSIFQLSCLFQGIDTLDVQAAGSLDLIIIEQQLDDCGWEHLTRLRSAGADARVCLITDDFSLAMVVKGIRAGVNGFICASIGAEALVESLKLIVMGESLLPSQLASNLPSSLSYTESRPAIMQSPTPAFTQIEWDVMRCLAVGYSNKIIARQLDITVAQAKAHLNTVLRKLSASNRTQVAIWAMSHGILGSGTGPSALFPHAPVLDAAAQFAASERRVELL